MSDESAGEQGQFPVTGAPSAPKLALGQRALLLACALLIGFVGGRSIAEAAGTIALENSSKPFHQLNTGEGNWVLVAMFLLALFVGVSFRFLLRLGHRVVFLLASVETRPVAWVAVTIIGCGVLCLFAAIALQWHQSSVSANISASLPTVELPGLPKGMMRPAAVSIGARGSLMVPITTLGVLLAGCVITGVGIWSSIPPRPVRVSKVHALRNTPIGWSDQRDVQAIRAEPVASADRPPSEGRSKV